MTHHSEAFRTTHGGKTWTLDDVQEVYPDAWFRSVSTIDGERAIAVTPFGVRTGSPPFRNADVPG